MIAILHGSNAATANHRPIDPAKADAVAKEFEAQFVAQMLGTMFATVEDPEMLSGGSAEQMYRSFLTDEYGKIIAKTGGIGVADHVRQAMLKHQESGTR